MTETMPAIAGLLLIVCVEAAAVLLVISGLRQRNRRELIHHLGRHRVLPAPAVPWVSRALPPVSITVGAAVLVLPTATVVISPTAWLLAERVTAGSEALLYTSFLAYLLLLRRRAPGQECGCLGTTGERTGTAIVRAAAIGVIAVLTAAGWPVAGVSTVESWPALFLLAAAVGGFAGVLAAGLGVRPSPRSAAGKEGWPA